MAALKWAGLLLGACCLLSCSAEVNPINPYDPDTPPDRLARASVSGRVDLEGADDVTLVEISIDGQFHHPAADGTFQIGDVSPSLHKILFRLEAYRDQQDVVELEPGGLAELQVQMRMERGSVFGTVQLQDAGDHSGATVVLTGQGSLTSAAGGTEPQWAALSAPSGLFVFNDIPVGDYRLLAYKSHYSTASLDELTVLADGTVELQTLTLQPVTGAVEILGGPDYEQPDYPLRFGNAQYTRTGQVRLHTEGFGAHTMMASEDPSFADASLGDADWVTYETLRSFDLSAGDGPKTVYVLLKGEGGTLSEPLLGSTILDTSPPSMHQVVVGDGSGYTDTNALVIGVLGADLPAESGIAEVRFAIGSPPGEADPWQDYQLDAPLVLADADGEYDIYAETRDRAGNLSALGQANVRLDRLAPVPGPDHPPVVIGDGSGYVGDRTVPVFLNMVDAITPTADLRMVLCQQEGCPGESLVPYQSRSVVTFTADGAARVYALFVDGAGNTYAADPVDVTVDTVAPSPPVVTAVDGQVIRALRVNLEIQSLGADWMRITEDADRIETLPWVAYQAQASYDLSDAEGLHTLYVQVRDSAGHEAGPASLSVVVDRTAPLGSVDLQLAASVCQLDTCYTDSESLLVRIDADDDTTHMIVSLHPSLAEPLQPFSSFTTVLLEDRPDPQQVWVRLIDKAGNTTEAAGDLISARQVVLDLDPPTLPVLRTEPEEYTNSTGIELELVNPASDNIGVTAYTYQIEPKPAAWGDEAWKLAPLSAAGDRLAIVLDDCVRPSCVSIIKLRAVDQAGNWGDPASVTMILDQQIAPLPIASVSAMEDASGADRLGSKVTNAEVANIWVTASSSADPNFEQFLLSLDGGLNWYETGVGAGSLQIPVFLAQDQVNEVWICGRDKAGNESCDRQTLPPVMPPAEATVQLVEDSTPPTVPVLYPDVAEINADRVSLHIHQPATDANGNLVEAYELIVNGQWLGDLPYDTERFAVDLVQESDNTVQLRALDQAGNRSGTALVSITENSTVKSMDTMYVQPEPDNPGAEIQIDNVVDSALENDLVVARVAGEHIGWNFTGLVIFDLAENKRFWLNEYEANHLQIHGGRFVAAVSLGAMCSPGAGDDPSIDPELDPICVCFLHHDDPAYPTACQGLIQEEIDMIAGDYTYTLVLVDVNAGYPVIRWISVSDPAAVINHPLLDEYEVTSAYRQAYGFDGRRVAWLQGCTRWGSMPCRVYASELDPACDPVNESCTWLPAFPDQPAGYYDLGAVSEAGMLSVGGDYLTWASKESDVSKLWLAETKPPTTTVGLLTEEGMQYNYDLHTPIDFDCTFQFSTATPACDTLFWSDKFQVFPELKALDLNHPALPDDLSAGLVVDTLADTVFSGSFEIDHLSASDHRVVLEDSGAGSPDVQSIDLRLCTGSSGSLDCSQAASNLAPGAPWDVVPSLSGVRVAYWRRLSAGMQLRLLDISTYPWLVAEAGMQAFAKFDDGSMVYSYLARGQADLQETKLMAVDFTGNVQTELGTFDSILLPVAYRLERPAAAAPIHHIGYMRIVDGGFGIYFCAADETTACQDNTTAVMENSVPGYPDFFMASKYRGHRQRMVLAVEASNSDPTILVDCDLDPSSSLYCGRADNNLRALLELRPQDCGSGNEYIRLCSFDARDDDGIIMLADECTGRAEIYRLDMAALDALATPHVITSVAGLEALAGFTDHLGGFDNSHCQGGDMEGRAAIHNGDLAIVVSTNECSKCFGEHPCEFDPDPTTCYENTTWVDPTPYLSESCETPPCCGKKPCQCDLPVGNYCVQGGKYSRILLVTAAGEKFELDGRFMDESDDIEGISINGPWAAWKAEVKGQEDIYLLNRLTGQRRRLTFAPTGQIMPILTEFDNQLQLVWTDNRLGDMKLFHTPLR